MGKISPGMRIDEAGTAQQGFKYKEYEIDWLKPKCSLCLEFFRHCF